MSINLKNYLRTAVEHLPHAAAQGFHVFGWRGVYLANAAYLLRHQPIPISLPRFGRVDSWSESINLIDNFALGELRCDVVEQHLTQSPAPCVIDVGVNVGVTCRWWLSLNAALRVIGIDMFQEALDFATSKITSNGDARRWQPICAAVGNTEKAIEVRYDDPLEGTSTIASTVGNRSRTMQVRRLDSVLAGERLAQIDLLKVDIEGAGGDALTGAALTLEKCKYVAIETHSDEETRDASSSLARAGLRLFHAHGRTIWWEQQP